MARVVTRDPQEKKGFREKCKTAALSIRGKYFGSGGKTIVRDAVLPIRRRNRKKGEGFGVKKSVAGRIARKEKPTAAEKGGVVSCQAAESCPSAAKGKGEGGRKKRARGRRKSALTSGSVAGGKEKKKPKGVKPRKGVCVSDLRAAILYWKAVGRS